MKGLVWVDENTLSGEMPKKEFDRWTAETSKQEIEIVKIIGGIDILEMCIFEKELEYRKIRFTLRICKSMCTYGTVFHGKEASIECGGEMELIRGIIVNRHKKGWKSDFLSHSASQGRHTLRQVVNDLLYVAKRDIDRYLDVETPEVEKAIGKIYAGIGRIKV